MGYNLYIGNARMPTLEPGEEIRVDVDPGRSDDAPVFPGEGEGLPHQVGLRWPSYGAWIDCMKDAGLTELFYNAATGLLRPHPGARWLSESHHDQVSAALAAWRRKHPEAVAQFETTDEDAVLARLVWLDFWIGWALKNCEFPAFGNS